MTNTVTNRGNLSTTLNTNPGRSANLWYDCPWAEIASGQIDGIQHFCHFDTGGLITAPTTEAALVGLPYSGFSSTASQITYDDAAGGGIVLAETTTQEGTSIDSDQHAYVLSNVAGSLWWECRFKVSSAVTSAITANEQAWFAGLMDTTACTVAVPLTAAGAIADINLVGFHKPVANTTAYDTSYKSDGNAIVEVNSDVGTIVDGTYFKVGMKFSSKDQKLRFYTNGLEHTTAKTIVDALGTTFPSDIRLGMVVALRVGSGANDATLTLDWWRISQVL